MLCAKCGKEFEPDVRFCPQCGNRLDPSAPPPPVPEKINTFLVPSICAALLCCLPLGVVAIVFSSKANSAIRGGDCAKAREYAGKAKMWFWIAVVSGIVIILLRIADAVLTVLGEE
ncbi:MAG: CD225/dispanin family protein [Lentisphaeria bacterium]|nr:CD225/dispanin family protein [Lentisphaeria bacterium]